MNGTVIVSLISFAGTLVGTLGGILTANHLTTYRLSQLEKKVERTFKLEGRMTEAEHDIRDIKNKT